MKSIREDLEELEGKPITSDEEEKTQIDVEEENYEKAMKRNEKLGDRGKIKEGKIVKFRVADGYAYYEVLEIGESISRVQYVPELCLDRWTETAVDHETGEILTSSLEKASVVGYSPIPD